MKKAQMSGLDPTPYSAMPQESLHHVLHELEVHQLELEMQNEELRRAESERDTSQARYFDFYDLAPVGYCTVGGAGLIEQVNLTAAAMLASDRKLLVGQEIRSFIAPDDRRVFEMMRQKILETSEPQFCELRFVKQDGTQFWAHLDAIAVPDHGGAPTLRVVMADITARKLAEVALRDSNAYLENLINYANAPIIVWDPQLRITRFNHAFELLSGYSQAQVVGQTIRVLFPIEHAEESMALILKTLTGERWNKVEIDIEHKDQSMRHIEWNSTTLMAPDDRTVISVIAQGHDITDRKRAEEEIKRKITELEDAFLGTVDLATNLSAMRDPYTAGHVRRVGAIAMAIGAELGFDAREQEGIRIAGYLHDIGKISIPTEILSKPGKISPIEYLLIQGHAQAGYDLLKDVKFPWEIALVALQHHERLDGSGYPAGLKGDAITMNSRIVAVADVVEAMSSRRPYRQALGIDAALAAIECGRATLFAANVVDACARLFRDKGYLIPD